MVQDFPREILIHTRCSRLSKEDSNKSIDVEDDETLINVLQLDVRVVVVRQIRGGVRQSFNH